MTRISGPVTPTALKKAIRLAKVKAAKELAQFEAGTLINAKTGELRKGVQRIKVGAGEGLSVMVDHTGARSWLLRVQKDSQGRMLGLGKFETLTLEEARDKVREIKTEIAAGINPARRGNPRSKTPTFKEAAAKAHAELVDAGRGERYMAQWTALLENHAFTRLGGFPVDEVSEADVRGVLVPLWTKKHETARKVQQRIERVILWAAGEGYRERSLDMHQAKRSLPAPPRGGNFAAMDYRDMPELMDRLSKLSKRSAAVLRYTILTASRPVEARSVMWSEIDPDSEVWTIPASKIKMKRDHRVPLSVGAMKVLETAKAWKHAGSDLVFPGQKPTKPMSDVTISKVLRKLDLDVTVHGFRATFRTWCAECTDVSDRVAEASLAHVDRNEMQGRYQRSDLLDKRRQLMQTWSEYLLS